MTAPSVPRVRLSGVELITDLFEAMHTLHFLRDSLEGAEFILALVMEKLPSAVGLVHFYDINSREFVVVRAVGPGAAKALQIRTSEKDPLIAEAMGGRRAVVIDDAKMDPRAQNGRWALIGSCLSLVCAPVEQGGRFLGLLALSNPRDGGPFDESDGHALTYMGEQFAEFWRPASRSRPRSDRRTLTRRAYRDRLSAWQSDMHRRATGIRRPRVISRSSGCRPSSSESSSSEA
jgi:hypothetical protein